MWVCLAVPPCLSLVLSARAHPASSFFSPLLQYARTLQDQVAAECSGEQRGLLLALLRSRGSYLAQKLRGAFSGAGTDDAVVIEV